jgi:pimeloyl-ACP methyl ester carboxylesterase
MKKIAARILAGLLIIFIAALGALFAIGYAPDVPVAALEARWATPPSQFIDLAGMKVHIRDEGPRDDPAPIVLIHGTSANLHTWDGWARELKANRRVISFDLPGFGLTGPSPDETYTISAYVRFVGLLLDRLGIQKCVIAGNSLGGNIAWATARAMQERIEKLILVDAGGHPLQSVSVPLGFRLAQVPVVNKLTAVLLPRRLVKASLENVYGNPAKVSPELVDQYFDMATRAGNRRALVQRFSQSDRGADAAKIAEIKVPTLILWGRRDRLIPPDHAELFHREIAGSKLVIFDDLGHVPQEEDPQRTVEALNTFLVGE